MALDSPAKRLQWARERLNHWESATEAARSNGWTVSTYLGHENGDRVPSRDAAKKYAKAYQVRWEWLLEGDGPPLPRGNPKAKVPGYVGGGAEIRPMNEDDLGDDTDIPPGVPANAIALVVRGDSMYPRYFDGEYLFYLAEEHAAEELLNKECVVKLADGRIFVKILRKGSASGLFNLESWNAPPMVDQVVEWASRVRGRS